MKFFEERLLNYFAACNKRLKQSEYLTEEFSLADICLYPFSVARRVLIEQQSELSPLCEWMVRMAVRRGVSRAMAVTTPSSL